MFSSLAQRVPFGLMEYQSSMADGLSVALREINDKSTYRKGIPWSTRIDGWAQRDQFHPVKPPYEKHQQNVSEQMLFTFKTPLKCP